MVRRKARSPRSKAPTAKPRPSKSQLKRDSTDRQALGVSLSDQPGELLDALDLPDRLRRAVDDLRGMTRHGAIRRQRQYIGRLMRDVDPIPIREALADRQHDDAAAKRQFRIAEQWRDKILREGQSAIDACTGVLPIDAERLGEIRERAHGGGSEILRKTAARELFRYLHEAAGAGKL